MMMAKKMGVYLRCLDVVLGRDGRHGGGHLEWFSRVLWGTFRGRLLAFEELYGGGRALPKSRGGSGRVLAAGARGGQARWPWSGG